MTLTLNDDRQFSDLPGIRIYYGEIQEKEDGTIVCSHTLPLKLISKNNFCSDFYLLFSSILPKLGNNIWLLDIECFDFGNLSDYELEKIEIKLDSIMIDNVAYLVDGQYFVKHFAPFVRDDWNRLWILQQPLPDIIDLITWYQNSDLFQKLSPYVDVIFDNYDGAYWSCFVRDSSLLKIIKQDLYKKFQKEDIEIIIIDISFKESLEQHQQQWKKHYQSWWKKP